MFPDFYTVAGKPPDPFFIVVELPLSLTLQMLAALPRYWVGSLTTSRFYSGCRSRKDPSILQRHLPRFIRSCGTPEAGHGTALEYALHSGIAESPYPSEGPGQYILIPGLWCDGLKGSNTPDWDSGNLCPERPLTSGLPVPENSKNQVAVGFFWTPSVLTPPPP